MAKENVVQASFSAGELSPHLFDRIDLEAYFAGCAHLRNFIPLPHGPILRRRGTHFIYEAKAEKVRLIPFSFNVRQSFVLEFTAGFIRVFYDDGILVNSDGTELEIATIYEEDDLPNLNWAQNGDWLFLTDGRNPPQVLKRYSNATWSIGPVSFVNKPGEWSGINQPRFVALFEQRAYYAATASQPQQVWASRTGLYEDFTMRNGGSTLSCSGGFSSAVKSSPGESPAFPIYQGTLTGTAPLASTGSFTSYNGSIVCNVSGSSVCQYADSQNPSFPFNVTATFSGQVTGTESGGSMTGTFDGTVIFGLNKRSYSGQVHCSVSGTVSGSGDVTILDDHAFTYTIFSNDTNGIEWLLPMGSLIIGTAGAEFKMGSTSAIDPVTPKNVRISVQTHYGSAPVRPFRIGSSVVFIQRSENRLRAFEYSFSEDQYTAQDLTIYASHVLEGRAKEMQVQSAPDSYIWIITRDGKLIGCTYEKSQKVLAWHVHETNGVFTSLCILPTVGNDRLYLAVEREINGETKTYIEVLIDSWEPAPSVEDAFYVDSGLTYEGEPTDNLVGLQHLEGKQVSILVDGWVHPDQMVVNGSISLQQPGSKIHVGIPFTSSFTSLIPQSQQRVTLGMTRRINEAVIAVEDSGDFFYRAVGQEHAEIGYTGPTRIMNKALPLTSRHQSVNVVGMSDRTQQLELWQDRPLPLIVRGIVYTINPSSI